MDPMELKHFRFEIEQGVAVVTIDKAGEPMNTLGPELLGELSTIIDRLETDDEISAVVLTSGKKDFLAGADIGWLAALTDEAAARAAAEAGQVEFARLERLHRDRGKPVVAAIHGACVGGGLETALVASIRIATNAKRTQLGQPEVQLGLIPGAGGTQRLPRVVGIATALDLILTGRSVGPQKALKIGLVDEVVPEQVLLEIAKKRAREAVATPDGGGSSVKEFLSPAHLQQLALEQNPMGRKVLFRKARERMLTETKGNYPAPEWALEAVRIGVEEGTDAGYAAEARFFGELVVSPESAALQSIFFATQMMKHITGTSAPPIDVDKVGVVGGGLMGAGIAAVSALRAGATVRIKDVDDAGVRRALAYVDNVVDGRVKRRRLRPFEAEQVMNRVTGTVDWSGFGSAELVIEAVFENLDLKRAVLHDVEETTRPTTVYATNTSSLPINEIAEASSRPETVIGMHYFSPVEKMPLLEVVKTDQTADWVISTAVAHGKAQGKTVIVVNDGPGFYTTRIVWPYGNEALFLLEDGASIDMIDGAMERWGFPVGPLRLGDEVGIDVAAKISTIMVDAFGERMQGPPQRQLLIDHGRLGRKNGRGFYAYDEKGKRGEADETVYADLGLGPRHTVPEREIQQRISLAMINEAALCLEEGIISSAMDGDIGAIMGLGFPPFRGGPFWWIDRVGPAEIVAELDALAEVYGERFRAAEILREHAATGERFR